MIIFVNYPLNDAKFSQIRDETAARKLAAIKAQTRMQTRPSCRPTLSDLQNAALARSS